MQARGKPRNFAPHRVAMQGAAVDRFVKHARRLLQRFARLRFVSAGGDCFRGSFSERAGPRPDRAVALGAFETLPMTLFGRWVNGNMRHNQSYLTAQAVRSNMTDRCNSSESHRTPVPPCGQGPGLFVTAP